MELLPAKLAEMEDYICAAPEVIAPRIGQPALANLLRDWQACRQDDRLPGRSDFSPESLRYILGNLILWDITTEPLTATYRLYGSNFAFQRGLDLTGKTLDDLPDPAMRQLAYHGLRRMLQIRQPLFSRGRYSLGGGEALAVETLSLPLAGDGQRIDKILHGQFNRRLDSRARTAARNVALICDSPDILRSHLEDVRLKRLLEDWDGWRGARQLPARRDVVPEALGYLLGHLFLFDIVPPEAGGVMPRFRYRLFGSAIAEFRGFDLTGRCIDQHPDGAFAARAQLAYAQATAQRLPLWAKVDAVGESGMVSRFEALILPLASDGEHPDMVLAAQVMV